MDFHQIWYVHFFIVEIWFGNAHWQILSILTELSARDMIKVEYYHFMFLFFLYFDLTVHVNHLPSLI